MASQFPAVAHLERLRDQIYARESQLLLLVSRTLLRRDVLTETEILEAAQYLEENQMAVVSWTKGHWARLARHWLAVVERDLRGEESVDCSHDNLDAEYVGPESIGPQEARHLWCVLLVFCLLHYAHQDVPVIGRAHTAEARVEIARLVQDTIHTAATIGRIGPLPLFELVALRTRSRIVVGNAH